MILHILNIHIILATGTDSYYDDHTMLTNIAPVSALEEQVEWEEGTIDTADADQHKVAYAMVTAAVVDVDDDFASYY